MAIFHAVPKVVVPPVDTTYWCSVQKLPRMPKEKYVVKVSWAAFVDPGTWYVRRNA